MTIAPNNIYGIKSNIVQGTRWLLLIDTEYDLTAATGTGKVRKVNWPTASSSAVTLDAPVLSLTNAAGISFAATAGIITVSASHTQTAAIAPGNYNFAVKVITSGGRSLVYDGVLAVQPGAAL